MLNPNTNVTYGTDPEAFFSKGGEIIGSEKLIPKHGLQGRYNEQIVRDGVQFEMHPTPSRNIRMVGDSLSRLFVVLQKQTNANPGVSISFDGLVNVTRKELDSLSEECRVLGCNPSINVYEDRPILVDPHTYTKRSSGGHIHMGLPNEQLKEERRRLTPLCDIFVGNTATLLDRDPGAAERRENYGRAGECRFPDHGLEYRTTSNFWLRDYALMDFTFGMANVAVSLFIDTISGKKQGWDDLVKVVDIDKIREAIDTSNYRLAKINFKRLIPWFNKYLPNEGFPLSPANVDQFLAFASLANKKGINAFLSTGGIVDRWVNGPKEDFRHFLGRIL